MVFEELAIPGLLKVKIIAVVGLSSDPNRPSHAVAQYLQEHGYKIIPINPGETKVLGEKAYPTLLSLPEELQKEIELVDVFRKSEYVVPHVQEAIALQQKWHKLKAVWLQLGIENKDAKEVAQRAGLKFIQNKCLMAEHKARFKG